MKAKNTPASKKARKASLLGLGLDAEAGDITRITRGKNFLLYGGAEETHAQMQETAIKLNESLEKKGKRLEDVSLPELRDMLQETRDK